MNMQKIIARINAAQIVSLIFLLIIMLSAWDLKTPVEPTEQSVALYTDYFLALLLPIQTKIMFGFALAFQVSYWLSGKIFFIFDL